MRIARRDNAAHTISENFTGKTLNPERKEIDEEFRSYFNESNLSYEEHLIIYHN